MSKEIARKKLSRILFGKEYNDLTIKDKGRLNMYIDNNYKYMNKDFLQEKGN